MKEILNSYAAYNVWANTRIINTILPLDKEKQMMPVRNSFPGVYTTLYHIWDAESIWWQRLKLVETISIPSKDQSELPILSVCNKLLQQNKEWEDWVHKSTEAAIQHEFIYQNNKKQSFKQPVWQMLHHIFNHGTYHRGQIVTMLHHLEVKKIPPTDYIVFSRGK